MDSINYTKARRNLGKLMNQVCDDNTPIEITRRGEASVVVMSLEEYRGMEETAYLLRSRTNALDLFESIGELENDQ